jgi:hypothetical protein
LRSSLNVSDQVSHPYKTTGKIIFLYILIFKFLESKLEDNSLEHNTDENFYRNSVCNFGTTFVAEVRVNNKAR